LQVLNKEVFIISNFKVPEICEFQKLENPFEYLKELEDYIFEDIIRKNEKLVLVVEKGEHTEEYRKEVSIGELIVVIILSKPFISNNKKFTSDFMLDFKNINNFVKYFNLIKDYFYQFDIDVKYDIGWMIDSIDKYGGEINYRMGMSVSLYSLIKICESNERFNYLMNFKIDLKEKYEIEELTALTKAHTDEALNILANTKKDNNLYNFINGKSGINVNQLGQVVSYIGLKPDFFDSVLSIPINTNFCRGYTSVTDYFINSVGARKALLMSKQQVKNAGWINDPSYSNVCR